MQAGLRGCLQEVSRLRAHHVCQQRVNADWSGHSGAHVTQERSDLRRSGPRTPTGVQEGGSDAGLSPHLRPRLRLGWELGFLSWSADNLENHVFTCCCFVTPPLFLFGKRCGKQTIEFIIAKSAGRSVSKFVSDAATIKSPNVAYSAFKIGTERVSHHNTQLSSTFEAAEDILDHLKLMPSVKIRSLERDSFISSEVCVVLCTNEKHCSFPAAWMLLSFSGLLQNSTPSLSRMEKESVEHGSVTARPFPIDRLTVGATSRFASYAFNIHGSLDIAAY